MADDLPHIPSPPLTPHLPGEEPQTAAPRTTATGEEGENERLVAMPALVADAVVSLADGLIELARYPACADGIRAGGVEPDVVARAAWLVRDFALRALDGEWSLPAPAVAEARRRAEVVCLARARRSRGNHLRAVQSAAVADAPTAEGLRAVARNMMKLADAAADPAQAEAMRAAGLRPDLMAHLKASAARITADAEHLARVLATARNDTPPAA